LRGCLGFCLDLGAPKTENLKTGPEGMNRGVSFKLTLSTLGIPGVRGSVFVVCFDLEPSKVE
jgi:hypothetical protein